MSPTRAQLNAAELAKPNRVIVAGCRWFNDYQRSHWELHNLLWQCPNERLCIIHGGAQGADRQGERYATDRGLWPVLFFADWWAHGKGAGHIRNGEMAQVGTHLIAFWDGESRGTKNMIEQASNKGIRIKVIEIRKGSGQQQ